MINFFRKIRLQLAFENKPGKYLRYAIGEIILVVIGILIALSINNWNENRKGKLAITNILYTIKSNLNSDIFTINEEFIDGNLKMDYWQSLIENADNDSLSSLFVKNIITGYIPVDNSGYTSMLSNNNLSLVSNQNLKSSLISYYEISLAYKQSFMHPLTGLAADLTLKSIEESMKVKNKYSFGKRMTIVLKDPSFVEMTNSYMRLFKIVLTKLEERKIEAQRLIIDIETELNKQ